MHVIAHLWGMEGRLCLWHRRGTHQGCKKGKSFTNQCIQLSNCEGVSFLCHLWCLTGVSIKKLSKGGSIQFKSCVTVRRMPILHEERESDVNFDERAMRMGIFQSSFIRAFETPCSSSSTSFSIIIVAVVVVTIIALIRRLLLCPVLLVIRVGVGRGGGGVSLLFRRRRRWRRRFEGGPDRRLRGRFFRLLPCISGNLFKNLFCYHLTNVQVWK